MNAFTSAIYYVLLQHFLYCFLILHENQLLTCVLLSLRQAIHDNNITAKNIYNWDEKGLLIRLLKTLKRIMSQEAYKSGRVR